MAGFLAKLADVATGGLGKEIIGAVERYFPPDMTPEQKAAAQLAVDQLAFERQKAVDAAANDAERTLNERIAVYEGTASDLKAVPILGPLMLFLRGGQRVVWGYAVLPLDYYWFWGKLPTLGVQQEAALYAINFLVLGFLFGERALRNVLPFVLDLLTARGYLPERKGAAK